MLSKISSFEVGSAPASSVANEIKPGGELRVAMRKCRAAFAGVAVFGALCNVLMLNGAVFMLEIYDRVLPSRSAATLVTLSVIALVLFVAQGLLDFIRSRILTRIGASFDEAVGARMFEALVKMPPGSEARDAKIQPMRDLDAIRSFLSSAGPNALFDMPWLPFYIVIIYLFHPLLGIVAALGAIVLVGLTVCTEYFTQKPVRAATAEGASRARLADVARRNAESLRAMGMTARLRQRYSVLSDKYVARQMRVSDVAGGIGSMSKMLRMILQSAMLGLGAWLVLQGEASAGIIIAGSILVGRALAPVDLAIANWKNFVTARQSWARLSTLLAHFPPEPQRLALASPQQSLVVERLAVTEPSGTRIIIRDIAFELQAGSALGIIGPSAAGKSTLARAMVGAWPAANGRVRLDGAELDQWSPEELGQHIGYLPQDVELFAGTVAENIARLAPEPDAEAVIAAANAAGPNSNLDSEGNNALISSVLKVRKRGGIVAVISHQPSILAALDFVLVMREGRAVAFGPRDEIMERLEAPSIAAPDQASDLRQPQQMTVKQRFAALQEAFSRPQLTVSMPKLLKKSGGGTST
ncbi:MAG: type I secretion system permease/ATPase [Alphaproteobacteria bacterium]